MNASSAGDDSTTSAASENASPSAEPSQNAISPAEADAHKKKMERVQAQHQKQLAAATREKGLIVVNTGAGKGKTTAALGVVFRALGHGMKVGVVQFIKGAIATGEAALAAKLAPQLEWHTMGEGFTWDTQDKSRDIAAARRGWTKAVELIRDPSFDLVVLDELNIVLRYDYLPLEEVLDELRAKREMLHVIITGRNAKPELLELSDLATDMTQIKHPYRAGIKPQFGIEF
ncbi:MAG TPA: cob(I)yrinic acid a,c-diamide adenosyltransferase [Pirellulales bacterium]